MKIDIQITKVVRTAEKWSGLLVSFKVEEEHQLLNLDWVANVPKLQGSLMQTSLVTVPTEQPYG